MAFQFNISLVLIVFTFFASSQLLGHAKPQVPCYFIFGDSIVDNGNNNLLKTTAKANYFPYGVDYPNHLPTGRFSNGRNLADFLAEYLGFKTPIPPFAFTTGHAVLKGVNYGSGASGIRNETGKQLGDNISMDIQLQNHKHVVSSIGTLLGRGARAHLNTCLYTVVTGNNDYINNYLMPKFYNTSSRFTPTEYASALTQQLSEQLRTLYKLGARKITLFGVGLLGCIPFEIDASGCSTEANINAQLFTNMLPPLVDLLNNNLTDAKFIYINVTQISLTPPANTGITVPSSPCCVPSTTIAAGQCQPNRIPCKNRTMYAFFDEYHPTELAYELEAQRAYSATTPSDATPYDIKTLVGLQSRSGAKNY